MSLTCPAFRRQALLLLLIGGLLDDARAPAGQAAEPPTNAPPAIALRDQYDAPQQLAFPAAKVTLLTIADHQGAEEVAGWIAALKPAYGAWVNIRGLADLRSVPGFLRGKVRRKFQEHYSYPVMLDWSGQSCEQLGFRHGAVNVLVLDRKGRICARFYGPVNEAALTSARRALDAALARAEGKSKTPASGRDVMGF